MSAWALPTRPIAISPDGAIRREITAAPGRDPDVVTSQLTQAQIADLASLFAGWDAIEMPRGNLFTTDGPEVELRYGDKSVKFGFDNSAPPHVVQIRQRLEQLARGLGPER